MTDFFQANKISVTFGPIKAVNEVSLSLEQGEIFAIVGPNGAGKTTFFNLISRIVDSTAGEFFFLGQNITRVLPSRVASLGIARTFQNIELFGRASVLQNLLLGRHVHSQSSLWKDALFIPAVSRAEIEHRSEVEKVIEFLRLQRYRDTLIASLPYGVRKIVEIGRALCIRPELILLDEPSSGLNVEETSDMAAWIEEVRSHLGITILLIEHDMSLVNRVSDRVLVLNQGRVMACGTAREVLEHPEVIRAYLGS